MRQTAAKIWREHPAAVSLIGIAGVLVIVVLAVLGWRVSNTDTDAIPPNVAVGGVEVGGMTPEQARRRIAETAEPSVPRITIEGAALDGQPVTVPTAALNPKPAVEPAIAEAMESRNWWGRLRTELGFGQTRDVPLNYDLGPGAVKSLTREVSARVDEPPRPARVVAGSSIRAVPGEPGRRVRTKVLEQRLAGLNPTIQLPVARVPSPVSTEEAKRVAARAREVIRGGVTVTGAGQSVRLTAAQLRGALEFPRDGKSIDVVMNDSTLESLLAPTFGGLLQEPRSAEFRITGDTVQVVPSQSGRALKTTAIGAAIVGDPPSSRVRARFQVQEPELTTAEARAMGIRRQVATFTTNYGCCPPRVTNIQRAASILDGQIIPAGGRFSLNEALGERTEDRGFVAAPQIGEDNMLEDAVGGGVSQVATTIFNTAWFAGLQIETHMPHTFYISRYPLGREATVSFGGPELIFVNDWPAAVLVSATATDTSITISFYSNPLGRRVESDTVEIPGNAGAPGARYSRTVFEGDSVKREDTYTWAYDPAPAS